jgi:drug/metabolite transporter (DMT)-like permease
VKTTSSLDAPSKAPLGLAGAVGAMIGWGASGVLAKAIDLGGLVVVSYRFWISTVVFFVYLGLRGRRMTWLKFRAALPGGVGLAADVAFFFSAIKLTAVANATVIVALQPLLMLYLSSRLLGESISKRQVFWAGVALLGVVVLLFGSSGLPEADWRGDLLAAGAIFGWTAYMYFSKATQDVLTPVEYTAITGLITAVLCTPLVFLFGQEFEFPENQDIGYLAAMVFGSGLAAHLLMNWSLTRIPVWVGSVMSLLIPAGATVMAWAFLDESVTILQTVGIGLTLLALGAIAIDNARS